MLLCISRAVYSDFLKLILYPDTNQVLQSHAYLRWSKHQWKYLSKLTDKGLEKRINCVLISNLCSVISKLFHKITLNIPLDMEHFLI